MKKVFAIVTGCVFVGLVACGPNAEEKKKMEEAAQKYADSVANSLLQSAQESATPAVDTAHHDTTAAH